MGPHWMFLPLPSCGPYLRDASMNTSKIITKIKRQQTRSICSKLQALVKQRQRLCNERTVDFLKIKMCAVEILLILIVLALCSKKRETKCYRETIQAMPAVKCHACSGVFKLAVTYTDLFLPLLAATIPRGALIGLYAYAVHKVHTVSCPHFVFESFMSLYLLISNYFLISFVFSLCNDHPRIHWHSSFCYRNGFSLLLIHTATLCPDAYSTCPTFHSRS